MMYSIAFLLFLLSDADFGDSSNLQYEQDRLKRHGVSGSGRVGDFCSFNTDCLMGMYCLSGTCTCLGNFVTIQGYCYIKKSPGESGCQYSEQCSAVWPGARCDKSTCECPPPINDVPYVKTRTRDGVICVLKGGEDGDPVPKCPLPEYDSDLLSMPASQLRNPLMTDPDDNTIATGEHVNPLQFCSSRSTDYTKLIKNGGGACVFTDGDSQNPKGIYIADLYDCLEVPMSSLKTVMMGIYDIHPDSNGICCPNRAFTCIQPKREADHDSLGATGVRPRWWYNAVTGSCEQFMWDPWNEKEPQSPNNFKTREHCESYCRDTCKRGSPQYASGNTINDDKPISHCESVNSCTLNFECSTVGPTELCCPITASICSSAGGRPLDPSRRTSFDPGYSIKRTYNENYDPSGRFFYDSYEGRCIAFTYSGGLGNFNNFKTSSECELFCAKIQCSYGSPLKIGSNNQKCKSNSECPSTHECQVDHSVCCPRPQAICSQPLRLGDCKQSIQRYWYNAITRTCEIFDYTGCQGNDNNFENLLECQNTCENIIPQPQCPQGDAYKDYQGKYYTCSNSGNGNTCPANYDCYFDGHTWGCCPTKAYTCSLLSSRGVTCGAGLSYRYFYNSQTQDCDSFQYYGCDGNSNNFARREDCENYCGVGGCPNGGSPERNENGLLITCSSTSSCKGTHECTSVNSGNSVINRCCPTRAHICSLPPQQGNSCSTSATARFYFNIVTKDCTQFDYNGCNGNLNNFVTAEQCNNFCLSSACSPGDMAYVNPNTRLPYECDISISNSCPDNFVCTHDQLSGHNVCCGASNMNVCPSGEKAYINAVDMNVRECLINIDASCPSNYLCRFNAQKNRYYCCASVNGDLCPSGKALYKDISIKAPIRCNTGSNQCPRGFSCEANIPDALQGYCCSSNYVCPNKAKYFIEESTQMPRSCTLGSFISCPFGYTCQSVQKEFGHGYCCEGSVSSVSDGCPPNEYAYVSDNAIVTCDPFNRTKSFCPSGYSCQWSMSNKDYQCCGSTPMNIVDSEKLTSMGCPSNQIAYKDPETKKPRQCIVAAQNCPLGFFCQFSSTNERFQCCGISGGCPNRQVAFIGLNGEPENCAIGKNTCPEGYFCKKLKSDNLICCSDELSGCNEKQVKIDGVCVDKSMISGPCRKEAHCTDGLICVNNICSCPPDMEYADGNCRQRCNSTTQVRVDERCLQLVNPGENCELDVQCQGKSTCKGSICECDSGYRSVESKCVEISSKHANQCPIRDQIAYSEPGTDTVRFCSTIGNSCPKGYNCQKSRTSQFNICCGTNIEEVSSTTSTSSIFHDVCDKGAPYLLNGSPQQCTRQKCPSNYECKFSSTLRSYYCCGEREIDDGCPSMSKALLFPSTGTPVQCDRRRVTSCPAGYDCVRNVKSGFYQCCSSIYRSSGRRPPIDKPIHHNNGPCPSYKVQVKRFFDGKFITRCESSCPMGHVALNGVCENVQAESSTTQ